MSQLHDFYDELNYSHSQSDQPWWEEVYRRAFVGFSHMVDHRNDMQMQAKGIDRTVYLKSGRYFHIDEKVRRESYPDILLERWSKVATFSRDAVPGWVQKPLHVDYIAYAFEPTRTCYMLPFPVLRRAWQANGRDWIDQYKAVTALNRDRRTGDRWATESIPVPIPRLMAALHEAMCVEWAFTVQPAALTVDW